MKRQQLIMITLIIIVCFCGNGAKADDPPEFVWGKQLGTDQEDWIGGVIVDECDNLFIVGYTKGTMGETNLGGLDGYLRKLNKDGDSLWTLQIGTSNDDECHSIAMDAEHNLYLGGYTTGDIGGTNSGGMDAFLAKYDNLGNQIWIRQFGSNRDDAINYIKISESGDIFVTGETRSNLAGTFGGDSYDAFIAKYNANGDLDWIKQYGTSNQEKGYGIATDTTGACYIVGSRGFVVKYDGDGNMLWDWTWPSNNYSLPGIAVDDLGYVYVGGSDPNSSVGVLIKLKNDSTQTQIWKKTFSRGWGLYYGIMLVEDGTGDIIGGGCQGPDCRPFARRYGPDGELIWIQESIGTMGDVCGNEIITDNKGNFYQIAYAGSKFFTENIGNGDGAIFKLSSNSASRVCECKTLARKFSLHQNFPNPFNPSTMISFTLEKAEQTTVQIYNATGQIVQTLVDHELLEAGTHHITFNANHLNSGIYFCKIQSGNFSDTQKLTFVK